MKEPCDWSWFSTLVREMRGKTKELMRQQKGGNAIMLSLSMIAIDLEDWIEVNPFSIDLRNGKAWANINGRYIKINTKALLYTQRLEDSLWGAD